MIGIPSDKFTIIGPSEDALWDYYGINIKNIESSVTSILKQLAWKKLEEVRYKFGLKISLKMFETKKRN